MVDVKPHIVQSLLNCFAIEELTSRPQHIRDIMLLILRAFIPTVKIKLHYRKMYSMSYLGREDFCPDDGCLIHSALS